MVKSKKIEFVLIRFLRYFYTNKHTAPFFLRFLLNLISAIIATYLFIPIVNVLLENIICNDPGLQCKYVIERRGDDLIFYLIFIYLFICFSGSLRSLYLVLSVFGLVLHISFSVVVVLNSFNADPNSSDPLRK
jgi:hypothetical protein